MCRNCNLEAEPSDNCAVAGKEVYKRMTEDEKRANGLLFFPGNRELKAQKLQAHKLSQAYNLLPEDETVQREAILSELLGALGEGSFIQGPIQFHYGIHTKIGHHFFGNFNLTIQDDAEVVIGSHCDFGPNTTIVTPIHPMVAEERVAMADSDGNPRRLCYALPVHIGNNCWFGAGVLVCPGVTIGDNCVIGAGSVVTQSIPENSLAAGNPCRIKRRITPEESMACRPELLADYTVFQK